MYPCIHVQCSMPVRLGPWQSRTFNAYSRMTGQWSDRSAMSSHKTLPPLGHTSCVRNLASKTWTSSWRREDFGGMDTFNDWTEPSSQPMTYRLKESGGLGGPRWPGSSWQRGIAESGSSLLSTLMIETPEDMVWDLPCVQLASYLEGGPLKWILSLNLHVNQKSDDDDDDPFACFLFHYYKELINYCTFNHLSGNTSNSRSSSWYFILIFL